MTPSEIFSFKTLHEQLGHKPHDNRSIVEQMKSSRSLFCQSLVSNGYLSQQQMLHAVDRYRLGITREGGVVFWQIDQQQVLRDGKVMYYGPDCHRDHDHHPSWASARLKQQGLLPESFSPRHCLFGLHLLEVDRHPVVAVVESEKTAVIMSELLPSHLWMACGGLTMLTAAMLQPLHDCKVILFPDTDMDGKAYQLWCDVAEASGQPIYVSDLLERSATPDQKARKIDIADLLFP